MIIQKVCVISQYYPTSEDPIYSFLDEVVSGFSDLGIECIVITPTSIIEREHPQKTRGKKTKKGNLIRVICPRYITYPARKIGGYNTTVLSIRSFCRAAFRAYRRNIIDCDIIYAHFINKAGIAASYIAKHIKKPCVVAVGESNLEKSREVFRLFRDAVQSINGYIAVSTPLKEELHKLGLVGHKSLVQVLPNAVDLDKFQPLDRLECRKLLKLPKNAFIVVFVGHFIDRKGVSRVIDAINQCEGVYGIFVGGHSLPKACPNALIVDKVPHDNLPVYLSAADVFVLPTQGEGSCNAIVEAQACGLPIISSDKPFNYDILSHETAILVNPMSVTQISEAIQLVRGDEALRKKLSDASIQQATKRNITDRVSSIVDFLSQLSNKTQVFDAEIM